MHDYRRFTRSAAAYRPERRSERFDGKTHCAACGRIIRGESFETDSGPVCDTGCATAAEQKQAHSGSKWK